MKLVFTARESSMINQEVKPKDSSSKSSRDLQLELFLAQAETVNFQDHLSGQLSLTLHSAAYAKTAGEEGGGAN